MPDPIVLVSASQQGAELRKERVNFSNFFFFFSMNPLIPLHATFMGNWDGPNLMTIGSSDIHLRRLDCCTLLCALKEVVRNKNQPWLAARFALKLQRNILIHGFTPILSALSVTTSLARRTPLRLRWAAAPPRGWTSAGRRRSSRYTPAEETCKHLKDVLPRGILQRRKYILTKICIKMLKSSRIVKK